MKPFRLVLYAAAAEAVLLTDASAFIKTSFDYVVIGGGTTGLSLASLLSSDDEITVGVIEAGYDILSNGILIPGLIGSTLGDASVDWLFESTPQPQAGNRTFGLGRGKVLGGSSALNFMAHTRASVKEYNGWEQLGNPGWNFSSIQQYIKKSEKWTPPDEDIAKKYHANRDFDNHGLTGSIRTTAYTFYTDIVLPYFKTLNNLGIPSNDAANGGNPLGVWSVTATVDAANRTRSFATNGYFQPRHSKKNLVVLTGAHATKILLSKSGNALLRATGVSFVASDGRAYNVKAKKEVILSAGSIQTPQLLELSGIGNPSILKKYGISTLVNLPNVGENLQDHPGIVANFQTLNNLTTNDNLSDPIFAAQQFLQYVQNRTGFYSSTPSTLAFLSMSQFVEKAKLSQLKKELDAALVADPKFSSRAFKLERSWIDDPTVSHLEAVLFPMLTGSAVTGEAGKHYYSMSFLLGHTWSRGSVHITSGDPTAAPETNLRYLETPADFDAKVLAQALKFALKVGTSQPMAGITPAVLAPSLNSTDAELEAFVHENLATNYHYIGTAAMLPREDGGVVDPQLVVYGTSNLRVVDASIMPLHVATHPTAALYGIAEKAAELILNKY